MDSENTVCPSCGHQLSMFSEERADPRERAAVQITSMVASWWFPAAILFGVATWALLNAVARPFEPYPLVVLAWISAVLATVAACQGPLILLAQRRAAMHDRDRDRETLAVVQNSEADLHEIRDQLARIESRLGSTNPSA